jgi:diaminopimelate epimerase
VLEFWVAESEKLTSIQEPFLKVYGKATVDVSTVQQWVRRTKMLKQEQQHFMTTCSQCKCTEVEVMPHYICQVDELKHSNCHITKKLMMLWSIYW